MNILVLSPFFPYPLTQGGKIRVFNIIKYLSRNHKITLACLSEEKVTDYGPLTDYCEGILVTHKRPSTAKNLFKFLTGPDPFNYVRYSSAEMEQGLLNFSRGKSFDLVQVEFPMMWQYARIFKGVPVTLDAHNIEADNLRQIGNFSGNPAKRLLYRLEEKRLRQREEQAWKECDLCLAVSEKESKEIASRRKAGKVFTVPNGVDLERFEFLAGKGRGSRALFLAGLDYTPNLDSALFLLKEIFPVVRSRSADIELDVVGRRLCKIKAYKTEGVEFHEDVPDVLPFFKKSAMLVVPLRQGAGTRIKILEAMASGLPVVSTSKGCEGLNVVNGEHILIANSVDSFASAVLRLGKDASLRDSIARNARSLVEERYSWEKIVQDMERLQERAVSDKMRIVKSKKQVATVPK